MATLVSVLQVFIKEPLLDWTKDANAPDPDYGVDGEQLHVSMWMRFYIWMLR